MRPPEDLLAGARWSCTGVEPGGVARPAGLPGPGAGWWSAPVPGTVAGALRAAGHWTWSTPDEDLLDRADWWFRTAVEVPTAGRWRLECDGLATVADVWLAGRLLVESRSMWRPVGVDVDLPGGPVELAIRFAALPEVGGRPRARWRTALLREPSLRWLRTSLAGRIPGVSEGAAAVGPWRPVRLVPSGSGTPAGRSVRLQAGAGQGVAALHVDALGAPAGGQWEVRCADRAVTVAAGDRTTLPLPGLGLWWPHTAGDPTRHPVEVLHRGAVVDRRLLGFREVEVRAGSLHPFRVNGCPVFVRGAVWAIPDQVALDESEAAVRASLETVCASGANMVRIAGTSQYPPPAFWDLCDEMGLLVWQDCMLAGFDPPADEGWEEGLRAEVVANLAPVVGRPSLAVVTGSNEAYQRAAMFGLPTGSWRSRALEEVIPDALGAGVAYLASSPVGTDLPFLPRGGIAHYFGVGAYRRGLDDPIAAGVSLAAECLAFATPPEPPTVRRLRAGGPGGGDLWAAGTPRDPGADWDFTDVTDHYVSAVLGGHAAVPADRRGVPAIPDDRALDLRRAAVCQAMASTFRRWRAAGSGCGGGLVLCWQDRRPGPGWGLLDVDGVPKAPWWVLRRLWGPVGVWLTDDGLGGLGIHVANDAPTGLAGRVRLRAVDLDGVTTVTGDLDVEVEARGVRSWSDAAVVGAFRDLNGAYRFGPPAHAAVTVELLVAGRPVGREAFLPGWVRQAEPSPGGLGATLGADSGAWQLRVTADRPLAWVAVDLDGWAPADNWFHLEPGGEQRLALRRLPGGPALPAGTVRALNSSDQVTVAG